VVGDGCYGLGHQAGCGNSRWIKLNVEKHTHVYFADDVVFMADSAHQLQINFMFNAKATDLPPKAKEFCFVLEDTSRPRTNISANHQEFYRFHGTPSRKCWT